MSESEAVGLDCDVVRVEVDESLSKTQLLETFINCGKAFTCLSVGNSHPINSALSTKRPCSAELFILPCLNMYIVTSKHDCLYHSKWGRFCSSYRFHYVV